jgi:hypothetical protein
MAAEITRDVAMQRAVLLAMSVLDHIVVALRSYVCILEGHNAGGRLTCVERAAIVGPGIEL